MMLIACLFLVLIYENNLAVVKSQIKICNINSGLVSKLPCVCQVAFYSVMSKTNQIQTYARNIFQIALAIMHSNAYLIHLFIYSRSRTLNINSIIYFLLPFLSFYLQEMLEWTLLKWRNNFFGFFRRWKFLVFYKQFYDFNKFDV